MSAKDYDAIVVGGGISGLSTAYALTRRGRTALVLESGVLGGVMRTTRRDGFTLEHGPNVLVEKPELRALIDEVGLSSEIVYPLHEPYSQFLWHNQKPVAVPKSPLRLAATPLVPLSAKLLLPGRLLKRGIVKRGEDDLSAAGVFSRVIGETAARTLVGGVLKGVYGGDIEKLSARSIFPDLWEQLSNGRSILGYARAKKKNSARPRIFVLRRGMSSLVEAIIIRLQGQAVFSPVRAEHIEQESGRFHVRTQNSEIFRAQELYLATCGPATAPLVEIFDAGLADELRSMHFASLAVVHVAAPKDSVLARDAFGVLFPEEQTSGLLGIMYNSFLFPHMAPPESDLFTVCFGGVGRLLEGSDEVLQNAAIREIQEKLGVSGARGLSVSRWHNAIPQYEVGHFKLARRMADLEKSVKGLYFVGADRGGIGVPDRVKAGLGRKAEQNNVGANIRL